MRAAFLLLAVVVAVANCQGAGDQNMINPPGCGRRPGTSVGKVVGGVVTIVDDWPWQIMMKNNGRFLCGGSVLNSIWIITAAHCTDGR